MAQRLKIVEKGWETFSDYFGGYKFTNGLSDEAVPTADAQRLGSWIRMVGVDDESQVGEGVVQVALTETKADVVVAAGDKEPETVSVEQAAEAAVEVTKYTREELEELADKGGIAALRQIGDKIGVKGRGIPELIREIIQKQG
ncbi:hypothetical protein [Stenotrophomonas phage BUCTxx99]|nr:hypothetical protein [Stenotrophomonas phage BUCTxx99]